ncbi:Hha toxicity modulator TomB [Edwardsiella piscicida]|uniref:Hha toxicity modulator TomB n=1 Tax=Edwardsiella piscicida TaxID=1263550 RepID=UPI0002C0D8F6|nr:Hha toxicity modulator TomB [Edwardsiella piscicida]AGH73090.1 Hha toxicity attenuator [Edwardsiella piscicida C07-087]AOP42444.1 Hha toxicity modulator TomB [Edwardsiella piscicida]EKS7765330.1 Hha toxicity modulator TomB [Edwardsiella piscicida]EKS7778776.1 Hha toxicity modulator TomB [Edwardsiella piscicida]EKS7782196.1 Hha toxicity modulator TomB [Edwardsiella piscicida]
MDEYTSYQHDIAELKYLCDSLYHQGIDVLGESHHGWVSDPTAKVNLQLNELIEHIASVAQSFKIKYPHHSDLAEILDDYLDETYALFGAYSVSETALRHWLRTKRRVAYCLAHEKRNAALHV